MPVPWPRKYLQPGTRAGLALWLSACGSSAASVETGLNASATGGASAGSGGGGGASGSPGEGSHTSGGSGSYGNGGASSGGASSSQGGGAGSGGAVSESGGAASGGDSSSQEGGSLWTGGSSQGGQEGNGSSGAGGSSAGGATGGGTTGLSCSDEDNDGYYAYCDEYVSVLGPDCGPTNFLVHPGALELPSDGVDQDCNGSDLTPFTVDAIYVDIAHGEDSHSGAKQAPKKTLLGGLLAAIPSQLPVFVAGGDYYESLTSPGSVSLYGGYSYPDWTRDPEANPTRILGDGQPIATSATLKLSGPAVIDGFDIVAASDDGVSECYAVMVSGTAPVRFSHNIIRGGACVSKSAGVVDLNEDATYLIGNTILSGTSWDKVFGYLDEKPGSAYIVNNLILGGSAPTVEGVHWQTGQAFVVNNTIAMPGTSAFWHAALQVIGDASGYVVNNILTAGADNNSLAFVAAAGASVLFQNNYLSATVLLETIENVPPLSVSTLDEVNDCSWPACVESSGNIVGDADLDSTYHLQASSVCIDAGVDPSTWFGEPLIDLEDETRPNGAAMDIGVDEF